MGVPRFFIEILKKYKNTHFWDPNFRSQYFFMDYNAFIHNTRYSFFKQITYAELEKLSVSKREQALANYVVEKTLEFVNNVVKPEKLLYIAFDGPVPKSKMVESRGRRYKAVKEEKYYDELRETFKIEEKDITSLISNVSISPGTTLMEKIASGLWSAIQKKKFMGGQIIAILDDTNIPGEGEHKILNFIRYLKSLDEKVCIYSPDADVIILSLQYKGDIYNIREKRFESKEDLELYPDPDVKYIIFSVTKYRAAIKQEFGDYDEVRLSRDLMFITFFIGNDFIKAIYFLKSNKDGFRIILEIYKRLLNKYKTTDKPYLVEIVERKKECKEESKCNVTRIPLLNQNFLVDIFQELSKMEDRYMKEYQNRILSKMEKVPDEIENTYEAKKASFQHDLYYLQTNPFAEPELFKIINYNQPRHLWNQEYYSYFFGIYPDNVKEFKNYKKLICKTYLESLSYCIQYYLTGLPSWKWYYPFRVAPMPSDILHFINDMPKGLDFTFELGTPYTPIEQLALMLPPQTVSILPRPLRTLITTATSPLAPYYPIDFKIDKVFGEKYTYSKPLLPVPSDEVVLPSIQETFEKFTKSEKERNKLSDTYQLYEPENLVLKDLILDVPRMIDVNHK
jgi:5'-3' exonuclease